MADEFAVDIAEAIRRIGTNDMIHTFMEAGPALIGADHDRDRLIDAMRRYGVQESGKQASAMGHTLVIRDYPLDGDRTTPLFIEASE